MLPFSEMLRQLLSPCSYADMKTAFAWVTACLICRELVFITKVIRVQHVNVLNTVSTYEYTYLADTRGGTPLAPGPVQSTDCDWPAHAAPLIRARLPFALPGGELRPSLQPAYIQTDRQREHSW